MDPFCYLYFVLVFVMPPSLFLVALLCGRLLGGAGIFGSLVSGVVLCFVAFPCGVPGQMWCLAVSIPHFYLLLYFE